MFIKIIMNIDSNNNDNDNINMLFIAYLWLENTYDSRLLIVTETRDRS